MKLNQAVTCALLSITALSFSQTKHVAYKSHSGNPANYKKLVANKPFSEGISNFGEGNSFLKERLDSVIYINKHKVILVTSKENPRKKTLAMTPQWDRRRDTIYNSPLLSKQHALDSIRNIYQNNGHFVNPMSEVKFIGYDNVTPVAAKKKTAAGKKKS